MKYHDISHDNMNNGDGLRVILWVSGCDHHCKNCHNPITWNHNDGKEFTEEDYAEIKTELSHSYISGITLSGGDPLFINNRESILNLVKRIKHDFPNKTIWLYTGYTWEQIMNDTLMHDIVVLTDVLVDGEYVEELKDVKYHWAGSTNQRVIDVKKSCEKGQVVLHAGN